MPESHDVDQSVVVEEPTQTEELEMQLKKIDALYAINPSQMLLNARLIILAEMMTLRNLPEVTRQRQD